MVGCSSKGLCILAITATLLAGGFLEAQTSARNPPTRSQPEKPEDAPARVETFAKRSAQLLVSERYLAGKVPDDSGYTRLELKAVVLYDASKRAERLKGVEVEIQRGTGQLPGSLLLDLDVAEQTVLAIAQLKTLSLELAP